MARLLILLALITATAACDRIQNLRPGSSRAEFDGVRFRAKLSTPTDDKRDILITVTPVAVNPEAALEAGRYEATKYCLNRYGGSDTAWTVGPDQPVEDLQVTDDTITLRGRCAER